jgi:SAM-dependent methyltransferase
MTSTATYYDRATNSVFDLADACPLDEWRAGRQGRFAVHPSGFPIFCPASAEEPDEYADGDPYQAEHASAFQGNRQTQTLELLTELNRARRLDQILDVGCGVGQITGLIAGAFPDATVHGMDRSITAIARATERVSSVRFVVADAYDLPFAPDSMDAIVCNNLWEHVPDPLRLLGELFRVLRTGGGLVLSTPSRYRIENLVRVLRGRSAQHMSRSHVTEYTVGQMEELLRFGGFSVSRRISRIVRRERLTLKDRVLYHLVAPAVGGVLRLVRSHHELGSTVFFLAVKA